VDEDLLDRARGAGARLQAAERDALLARADYHAAIRRLHLSGATLREIAAALALSHQRVQQIVNAAGGSWWTRAWRTRKLGPEAVCTWCARSPSEVSKLIAGPKVFVCDRCAAAAAATLSRDRAAAPFSGRKTRGLVPRCAFCGKGPSTTHAVAVAGPGAICADCAAACREILEGSGA
jgi:hypothetical protein